MVEAILELCVVKVGRSRKNGIKKRSATCVSGRSKELTEYHQNKKNIKYHIACKANGDGCMDENRLEGMTRINDHEFEFHNAHCFKIDVPQIGSAQAIYYDVAALKVCCEHIKKNHISHPIVYIMACRIGPFARHFYKEIHKLGGIVYLEDFRADDG